MYCLTLIQMLVRALLRRPIPAKNKNNFNQMIKIKQLIEVIQATIISLLYMAGAIPYHDLNSFITGSSEQ